MAMANRELNTAEMAYAAIGEVCFRVGAKTLHSFRRRVASLTVRSVPRPPAGQGAVHPLHQGAAVSGVVPGSRAAVQRSGPRGRGHAAAGGSRLPGRASQH